MSQLSTSANVNKDTYLQTLKQRAMQVAEEKFDGVAIACEKNVLLLKKNTSTLSDKPFFTIKVNYYDTGFHYGDYDMAFNEAADNFRARVDDSFFGAADIPGFD